MYRKAFVINGSTNCPRSICFVPASTAWHIEDWESAGGKSSLEEIIERTNKQTDDETKPLAYLHSLDLGISLFRPVVLTTASRTRKKPRVFIPKLNNKTTNCRWNNFGNVVHSLNIINGSEWKKLRGELDWLRGNETRNCFNILWLIPYAYKWSLKLRFTIYGFWFKRGTISDPSERRRRATWWGERSAHVSTSILHTMNN